MNNINKPAPKWYRITKKLWAITENTIIAMMLIYGHGDGSKEMLIYKLVSSYLKEALETILVSDTEDYTPK